MLREADSIGLDRIELVPAYASARPAGGAAIARPANRYGEGKRLNSPAMTLTIALHIVLVAALFMVRDHFVHKRETKLTVMNLTPTAPPPPSEPEQPQTKPVVVAPRPIVRTPVPPVTMMQTTPDPTPQPVALPPAPPSAVSAPPAPPAPPSIMQASDLGSRMVSGKPPRYPVESRRKHEQGTVVLMLILGVDGKVSSIAVNQSSGFARLDDAALDAVRKWRWEPIVRNGQPVMVKGLVEIPFVLQG
ncbi:MAG: TonB family protein [Sphingobium sp.]